MESEFFSASGASQAELTTDAGATDDSCAFSSRDVLHDIGTFSSRDVLHDIGKHKGGQTTTADTYVHEYLNGNETTIEEPANLANVEATTEEPANLANVEATTEESANLANGFNGEETSQEPGDHQDVGQSFDAVATNSGEWNAEAGFQEDGSSPLPPCGSEDEVRVSDTEVNAPASATHSGNEASCKTNEFDVNTVRNAEEEEDRQIPVDDINQTSWSGLHRGIDEAEDEASRSNQSDSVAQHGFTAEEEILCQVQSGADDHPFSQSGESSRLTYEQLSVNVDDRTSEESSINRHHHQSPSSCLGSDYTMTRQLSSDSIHSDGGRSSQEPVNRTPVEKVAAPEITKSVRAMFESGQIPDRHEIRKTIPMLEEPTDSGVFENEPVQREGVVRSGDYVNDVEEFQQRGTTKSLLSQWNDKGKEEFRANKKPITLAEDEGRVLESEPVRRSDVSREDDTDLSKDLPSKGQAKLLTQQWTTKTGEFQKEQKPIRLYENENEPSVIENEPQVRTDVLREEDSNEEIWMRKGFTRDLAGFWSTPKQEAKSSRDAPIELPKDTEGVIAENDPKKLEGVASANDPGDEVVEVERGRAKSLVSKWQTMPDERKEKRPFQLDVNPDEVGVYENEPVQLVEGVVRSHDLADECVGQKGMIKNIAGRFLQTEPEDRKPRDQIVIEMAEGPSVLENNPEPVRADVVRSEYVEDVQVERGTTKNLVQRWKNQDLEQTSPGKVKDRQKEDPTWILEAEKAAESGVFENDPHVRQDVFREVDYQPEVISAKQCKNMREMWNKMGQDDGKKDGRAPQLVRFTPPRELTPPRVHQEDFKSFQSITLASDAADKGPSPPQQASQQQQQQQQQQKSPKPSPGGSSYSSQQPSDQTVKSSASLVLKSS